MQEYAGRPEESLRTCREAVEWARRAEDTRLQAALHLRLADSYARLGDPASAALHREHGRAHAGRGGPRRATPSRNMTLTPAKSAA
ncbi:hypothetical protein GCM10019016_136530 [Streptomyces prasinosporus]|uniref:Tetratricopeptide repeat protein n=1 Tax=Streptomyces prasinosporus TaxID=68256 RepID=A0ABP6UFJ9_9ACTN